MKGFYKAFSAISATLAISLLPNIGFAKLPIGGFAASNGHSLHLSVVTYSPGSPKNAFHSVAFAFDGPTWHCTVAAFGSAIYSGQTLGGSAYTSCTQSVNLTLTVHAEYRAPFFWGCIFQDEGQMGRPCEKLGFQLWCPLNNAYERDVQKGQLWAVYVSATAIDSQHNIATGDASMQVQF